MAAHDFKVALKNFNQTTKEYFSLNSENACSNLLQSLKDLTISSELNELDPGSRETIEFFVNLHELMSGNNVRSDIMWGAFQVLQKATRLPSIMNCIIHSFKFVPVLTKILEGNPLREKKIEVLQLIQELTYGIKILWQEAHLPFLISSLTKWITGDDPELIPIALGILVNLCYTNMPAVYTLMKSVDIKQFLKILLKLQKNSAPAKVQVCKLLIILKEVSGGVPEDEMETYIRSTCPTLAEAVRLSNAFLMKHVVNFFKEIVNTGRAKKVISDYPNYAEDIEKLLNIIVEEEDLSEDCLAALFDYLCCVIDLQVFGLEALYPHALGLALRSIGTKNITSDALTLVSKITADLFSTTYEDVPQEKNAIMECVYNLLNDKLPEILTLLDTGEDSSGLKGNEAHSQQTSLILLFSQLIKLPMFCSSITSTLDESIMRKFFEPLLNPSCKEKDLFQKPVYSFYVEALCFLTDLSDKQTSWLLLYNELLQEKQVQTVLAIALYTGPEYIKKKVLTLIGTTGFSTECLGLLASQMTDLNKAIIFSPSNMPNEEELNSSAGSLPPIDLKPILTITQMGHLENVLKKCEQVAAEKENIITSSVMELYHYKITVMDHNMRQMLESQKAADQRVMRLQHTLMLTSSEVSRLHQLLHGTQQNFEIASKESISLASQLNSAKNEAQELHNKYSQALQNLRSKTVIISNLNSEIDDLKNSVSTQSSELTSLRGELKHTLEQCSNLNNDLLVSNETIAAMKKNVLNLESQLDTLKKESETKSQKIESLKKEIMEQCTTIKKLEKSCSEKDKELNEQRRMREIISELAMGKRKIDK